MEGFTWLCWERSGPECGIKEGRGFSTIVLIRAVMSCIAWYRNKAMAASASSLHSRHGSSLLLAEFSSLVNSLSCGPNYFFNTTG
jgi:hypothetical protein